MDAITMGGLIKELGGAAAQLGITAEEESSWTVSWGETDILTIEWVDHPPRLVSTVMLGEVPAGRKLVVYEAMLTYNLLWRQTWGARMALGGPDGEATLVHEMAAEPLTVPDLGAALARICHISSAWMRFVQEQDPVEGEIPQPWSVALRA